MFKLNINLTLAILTFICPVKSASIHEFNEKIKISVFAFGAKGDGFSDDASAFKQAFKYCVDNNLVCEVPQTKVAYNIGSTVQILLKPGQSLKIVSNGAIIKPLKIFQNHSAYNLTLFQEHIFFSIGAVIDNLSEEMYERSKGSNISVSGLVFDGENLKATFAPQSYNTHIFIGLQALGDNVNIQKCVFRNIFGYGIRLHNITYAQLDHNLFKNVGGRGATLFAQKADKDAFGDALYFALIKKGGKIDIKNCELIGMKNNGKRSRSGITFEYSIAPYTVNLKNIKISGYAKSVHIEESSPTLIYFSNVRMDDFNFGIANVLNNKSQLFLKQVKMEIGETDKNDSGDALAFLNYKSTAQIFLENSYLNFKGRYQGYQSAVGLVKVSNSTINGNSTNFFFADGNTTFYNCRFIDFGGSGISFFSHTGIGTYKIMNSQFINCQIIKSLEGRLKLILKNNTKH